MKWLRPLTNQSLGAISEWKSTFIFNSLQLNHISKHPSFGSQSITHCNRHLNGLSNNIYVLLDLICVVRAILLFPSSYRAVSRIAIVRGYECHLLFKQYLYTFFSLYSILKVLSVMVYDQKFTPNVIWGFLYKELW